MVVIIRLVLYIDLIFTDRMGAVHTMPEGKTINTMVKLSVRYARLARMDVVSFFRSRDRSLERLARSSHHHIIGALDILFVA